MNRRGFFATVAGLLGIACGAKPTDDVCRELGLSALPWLSDAHDRILASVERKFTEHSERMAAATGHNAVCVAARDTRKTSLVGRMRPSDTVLHSTGCVYTREWSV